MGDPGCTPMSQVPLVVASHLGGWPRCCGCCCSRGEVSAHSGGQAPSAIWALSSTKQANFTVAVVLPRSAWTRQLTWSAGQFRLLKLKPQQPR